MENIRRWLRTLARENAKAAAEPDDGRSTSSSLSTSRIRFRGGERR
jgi:hypothetical protein